MRVDTIPGEWQFRYPGNPRRQLPRSTAPKKFWISALKANGSSWQPLATDDLAHVVGEVLQR
jgi:hypothetical protein